MKTLLFIAVMAAGTFMPKANAQITSPIPVVPTSKTSAPDPSLFNSEEYKKSLIAALGRQKDSIISEEKYKLKQRLIAIDKQVEAGTLDASKANEHKEEAARNAALNIDNKSAIIQNKIELAKRGEEYDYNVNQGSYAELGFGNTYNEQGSFLIGFHYKSNRPVKYDKRTFYNMVFAFGFNNTIGDGKTIGDEYHFGRSQYAEIGVALRTRLLKNSNILRLVYGISYQQNLFTAKGNRYFVNNNGVTELQEFSYDLRKKSYLRMDNFIVPIHLEIGPGKKKVYKDYFRYDTSDSFKAGIGGFAGYNIGAMQRLKYEIDGQKQIEKLRTDYNLTRFVYGLSTYVGYGPLALYAKYDLNPVFSSSAVKDHNIAFALRVDL